MLVYIYAATFLKYIYVYIHTLILYCRAPSGNTGGMSRYILYRNLFRGKANGAYGNCNKNILHYDSTVIIQQFDEDFLYELKKQINN